MTHSPAQVIAQLLRDESVFTNPSTGGSWPLYVSSMPDGEGTEDDCGCAYDTAGEKDGRLMTGTNLFKPGIQIRVRSLTYESGWQKASAAGVLLEATHRRSVTIDGSVYFIDSFIQTSPVFSLGAETKGTKRREIFTLNGLVIVEQTT